MNKIILLGGGGHCKSVIDSIESLNEFEIVGILDVENRVGQSIMGYKIIGTDSELNNLYKSGVENAFISLGSIGNTEIREKIAKRLLKIGFNIPNILDPSAKISKSVSFKSGIFVGKGAIVNSDCIIGDFSIINSGAIIEHDCVLGSFVHCAPGSVLCGGVSIGDKSHIGANSTIKQGIHIENNVVVGIGTVILNDIKEKTTVVGNPGRTLNDR